MTYDDHYHAAYFAVLPGCVSRSSGQRAEEAVRRAREIAEESCEKHGLKPAAKSARKPAARPKTTKLSKK